MTTAMLCAALASAVTLCEGAAARAATTASPAHPVKLVVTLKLRHASELDDLISKQTNPASPLYAHFLTPGQFRTAYAPTATAYAATIVELTREGFTIDRRHDGRTLVDVSADTATVERSFGVRLRAAGSGADYRYLADRKPLIGAALSMVAAIGGLEPDPRTMLGRQSATIGGGAFTAVGPDSGYSPVSLTRASDLPLEHGFDGTGTVVADLVDGAPERGLHDFLAHFRVSPAQPSPVIVAVNGGGGEDIIEPDFDFEWLYATAPGATMYDYDLPSLTITNIVDAFEQIASDDRVDVVNLPFGACENFTSLAYAALPLIEQAAAQGIAFEAVSFGGAAHCGFPGVAMPTFPADGADVLAIGGSNTITGAAGAPAGTSGFVGSGGGISLIVPLPSAQKGVAGIAPGGRNVPDVTLPAEIDGTGPSFNYYSYWAGGAPLVNSAAAGGLLAELTQMSHHRLGAFDKTLYALFKAAGYGSAFHDITVGCNGTVGSTPACAGPNYDRTSGLGSLDAYALGKLLGASK